MFLNVFETQTLAYKEFSSPPRDEFGKQVAPPSAQG